MMIALLVTGIAILLWATLPVVFRSIGNRIKRARRRKEFDADN